ncbi:hypothetical protein B0H16DRAFT_1329306, partial [Mycena metata]
AGSAAEVTPTATQEVEIAMPDDAPSWFSGCITQLCAKDLRVHFTTLLKAFVTLETMYGFDEDTYSKLPATNRLKEVGDWIKGGRNRNPKLPVVKNVSKYAEKWKQWWDTLQPGWRCRDHDGNLMAGGAMKYGKADKWGVLDCAGPNGWLTVVASLYFWGVSEQAGSQE